MRTGAHGVTCQGLYVGNMMATKLDVMQMEIVHGIQVLEAFVKRTGELAVIV